MRIMFLPSRLRCGNEQTRRTCCSQRSRLRFRLYIPRETWKPVTRKVCGLLLLNSTEESTYVHLLRTIAEL
jgi:hypothetical protein